MPSRKLIIPSTAVLALITNTLAFDISSLTGGSSIYCIDYSARKNTFSAGTNVTSIADPTSWTDSNGDTYTNAYDVTIDAGLECESYYMTSWNVEWTVNSADADAVEDMFTGEYFELPYDSDTGYCEVLTSSDTTTYSLSTTNSGFVASGDDSTNVCAYDILFEYASEGTDSSGNSITGTSQTFTIYFDNAIALTSTFSIAILGFTMF
jgi:hypothetical protein